MARWSQDEYQRFLGARRALREPITTTDPPKGKAHKYRATAVTHDGVRFDSKLSLAVYLWLEDQRRAGLIAYALREVPLRLPGNVTYRVDYQVHFEDRPCWYIEAKGLDLALGKAKRKIAEAHYGITIQVVTRETLGALAIPGNDTRAR